MEQTNITSTTPKDCEGINISYSMEQEVGKKLLEILPDGWKVHFTWCQIAFKDVAYEIDKESKTVFIAYNQNLYFWWNDLMQDIKAKLKE